MAQPQPQPSGEAGPKNDGLSAFAARILDQLALTAWLPAAMLVCVAALLIQLRLAHNIDIPAAVENLATQPWGVLVILAFSLVLATMVTQAFSFEAIRLLEGYWPPWRPFTGALRWGVRRQVTKWNKCRDRAFAIDLKAFQAAETVLLATEDRALYDVWHDKVHQLPRSRWAQTDLNIIKEALATDWREHADPSQVAEWEAQVDRLRDFPRSPRTFMPTKLGNCLRAAEEQLEVEGAALERYVMNRYEQIPTRLTIQHDQFRARLDMYCTLALVFSVLGVASIPLVWDTTKSWKWVPPLVAVVMFAALARMSYSAAIASAKGFGAALLAIKDVTSTGATGASASATSPTGGDPAP